MRCLLCDRAERVRGTGGLCAGCDATIDPSLNSFARKARSATAGVIAGHEMSRGRS